MIIEIDTKQLEKLKLSPTEYVYAYLLRKELYSEIMKLEDDYELSSIDSLINKGYINDDKSSFLTMTVSDKFEKLFKEEDFFDELYDTFPTKVTRPEGNEQYLRTAKKECRRKYNTIVRGSKRKHKEILSALKAEITHRINTDSMKYFKTMLNWLKAEEYEAYIGIEVKEASKPKEVYGTSFF